MGIPNTNKLTQGKMSPPPIHEDIVDKSRATQSLIRFLLDLRRSGFNGYDEIDRVINFANNIQEGAGLEEDGTYLAHAISHYISSATSLNNADLLLDSAIWDYTREAISSITADVSLFAQAQTVLCDATAGEINITMPNPSDCFENNRSFRFAIHKIDSSSNAVNIVPNDSELIVGEASQYIDLEGEILNFITDGTNWYLGA